MAREKPVHDEIRKIIENYSKEGRSCYYVAKTLKIPYSTVKTISSNYVLRGSMKCKRKTGRPLTVNARDLRTRQGIIKKNRRASASELSVLWGKALGRRVSVSTCSRKMKKLGYSFYKVYLIMAYAIFTPLSILKAKEKPLLTNKQKKARLIWAKKHLNWTNQQWDSIIWSDESRFEVCVGDSRKRVLRKPEETYHPDYLVRKVKFPA
ncbi:hypothetical protein ILUMI_20716 [Ignelater luminosus]|uniref:Transposase Tc1-like domain-containing protein n=1 Tax=Ignelater luminosus TaxID=2038154 RepID=A0A8K0G4A5_IGNLU|nr:hypothetical protein ILUMI_20716 [Ignelater luminosus]